MNYRFLKTKKGEKISGPIIIQPEKYDDDRGFFMESWNHQQFSNIIGKEVIFCQDNHSHSKKGVLRGMHYQKSPHAQAKLIRCICGEIFDVVIDIRVTSNTFGEYGCVYLDSIKHQQLWIPEGFAHGFLTISDSAEVLYKTNYYWNSQSECSVNWNDPNISISWPNIGKDFIISAKDKLSPILASKSKLDLF